MWYSLSAYHVSPYCEVPTPQSCLEKSSLALAGRVVAGSGFSRAELLDELVLLSRFALPFRLFTLLLRLLFESELILATAIRITAMPMPRIVTTASPPSIHHTALDLCLRGGGSGEYCGCG